jgi:Tfp pilus assembly protein PilF
MESTLSVCRMLLTEARSFDAKWPANYVAAEKHLREELSRQKNNIVLLTCLGAVLCDRTRYAEAMRLLQMAVQLGSTDRNTYFNLGVAMLNVTTHEEAMLWFKRAGQLSADPRSWEAYFDPQAQ